MSSTLTLRSIVTGFACVTALAVATPAMAETVNFKASLDAKSEVPPNDSKGTGSVTATFDTATKKLTWKGTFANLTGPATASHLHGPAEPGKNAGVAVPINATSSPFEGSATLTDAQAADLMAGRYYVNFHTATNKGGEIRGQLVR